MQMLGFAPYHMKLLVESMRAEYDAFSGIKRYSKEDSDKWFSDYDVGPAPPPPRRLASSLSMNVLTFVATMSH